MQKKLPFHPAGTRRVLAAIASGLVFLIVICSVEKSLGQSQLLRDIGYLEEQWDFEESIETVLEIINMTGEVIFQDRIFCGGDCGEYVLIIKEMLVPGIYVVNMNTEGVRSSKRLLDVKFVVRSEVPASS